MSDSTRSNGSIRPTSRDNNSSNGSQLPSRNGRSRSDSVPMMPAFMVSAPGKVIVYGEHAVVHGKAAIAASISLRSYLLVTFLSKHKKTVRLVFPDIDLDHTWNIADLPWRAFSAPGKKKFYDLVTDLQPELVDAMKPHIANVSLDKSESQRKIHQASASSFLYLFLSLGSPKSSPCVYTLRSTIPIGAGLGSSASIAVCFSAALLLQIRALAGPHEDQPPEESELQIERINRWAFVGELCTHGNPSGVDNTVSSGGKAVLFQRQDYTRPPQVLPLRDFPELPLLLVNTRQSRSTAGEVAKVTRLKKKYPEIAELVLDSIHKVTKSAHDLITSEDFDPDDPKSLQTLGELITVNHGLLVSLGVSHPKLERIRALIDHAGIGWTKLTGAGGGGCAITILKPECLLHEDESLANGTIASAITPDAKSSPIPTAAATAAATAIAASASHTAATTRKRSGSTVLTDLRAQLEREGFDIFPTTLAGDGVGVLWPAVLHNTSGEEGGEEIDQDKFLRAVGNQGIEALVGVGSGLHALQHSEPVREGWKFWRP